MTDLQCSSCQDPMQAPSPWGLVQGRIVNDSFAPTGRQALVFCNACAIGLFEHLGVEYAVDGDEV